MNLIKINFLVIIRSGGNTNNPIRVYPQITIGLKCLLLYPNLKGDKRKFKLVSVQKWDTPSNLLEIS
jgi:hypothetical protein